MATVWIQNQFDNLPMEGYRKQRFWLMAEAFAAAGHSVVLWTSDFSHAKKASRKLTSKADGRFELRLIRTLPYRKNVSWERVRSHCAYAREWERVALASAAAPDLVISSIPSISAATAGLKLARRFGVPFVLDVMDAWPETFERLAPKGFRWFARLLLTPLRRRARRLYRDADLVTGVCGRYRELTGRADYWLAYHGIDLSQGRRDAETVQGARRGPRGGGVRLAYAGNLGKSYDLATVIEGVGILRAEGIEASLDVAGFGGAIPETEGVRFHGLLGEEALGAMLSACDVGVIPMRPDSWVGLPYKICDYAMSGLRIVSSLGGESGRLLAEYACGVGYAPGDARSFADAVRSAMELPAENARKLVAERLDAQGIYRDYVRTCLAIVGR